MNQEDPHAQVAQQAQHLSEMLFGLRDSLMKLSLALKDSQLSESEENQQQTRVIVSELVSRLKS